MLKFQSLPQNRKFYGKMEYIPLWPSYIGEKGRTLGKTYGINKVILGTPLGNILEPDGNPLET
jgi:hypothetical protein